MKSYLIKKVILIAACGVFYLPFVVLGIVSLSMGTLCTPAFLMSFFVIPCVFLSLGVALILARLKTTHKVVLCILLFLSFSCSMFAGLLGRFETLNVYENGDVSAPYTEMRAIYPAMPALDYVGEPMKTDYLVYTAMHLAKANEGTTCVALKCRYSEADYALQKALLEQTYTFAQTSVAVYNQTLAASFAHDGYVFRPIASGEGEDPLLIATNNDTCEIFYLSFYTQRPASSSAVDFLRDVCGWERIKSA